MYDPPPPSPIFPFPSQAPVTACSLIVLALLFDDIRGLTRYAFTTEVVTLIAATAVIAFGVNILSLMYNSVGMYQVGPTPRIGIPWRHLRHLEIPPRHLFGGQTLAGQERTITGERTSDVQM